MSTELRYALWAAAGSLTVIVVLAVIAIQYA
ncbi:YnhF family membrane protein [Ferrimonas balearica]|nr:YnhF family membrane protein [Ferrimonas balearica]MBY5991636.1 YnhF family membrane protein [Ferrimonas balearica]